MAREFTAPSTDRLVTAASGCPFAGSFSVAFWAYIDDFVPDDPNGSYYFVRAPDSVSGLGYINIYGGTHLGSDGITVQLGTVASAPQPPTDGFHGLSPWATGAWHHIVFQYDESVPSITKYVDNGGADTELTTSTLPTSDGAVYIGANDTNHAADGRLAEMAVFTRVLTPDERAGLAKGFSPLFFRPQVYWPLINSSPEPELMTGKSATVTGAAAIAHPRMFYPSRPTTGGATSNNIFLSSTFAVTAGFQADHVGVIEVAATLAVTLGFEGSSTYPPFDKPLSIVSIDVFPALHISRLDIDGDE